MGNGIPPVSQPPSQRSSAPSSQTQQGQPVQPLANDPKFRLASELCQSINLEDITEKIMKMPVNLELREVLGTSNEIAQYFIENIRKRRRPIEANSGNTSVDTDNIDTVPIPAAHVNAASADIATPLYACASPRADTYLEDILKVNALIDHGSEICLMPKRVCDHLGLYVDTEVAWTINTFDTGTKAEIRGPLGVCHRVKIDVGGVEVRIPIFIVEDSNTDLLLGMPWIHIMRAATIVEDDGSVSVHIKSIDGRTATSFTTVKANHERNRHFVKHPELGSIGTLWGKV